MPKATYDREKLQITITFDDVEDVMAFPVNYMDGLAAGAFISLRAVCALAPNMQEKKDA